MDSTKLYFLLSFKINEYKKLKIEVILTDGKKQKKENLTNVCDINNINDYIIQIGIFDFGNRQSKIKLLECEINCFCSVQYSILLFVTTI